MARQWTCNALLTKVRTQVHGSCMTPCFRCWKKKEKNVGSLDLRSSSFCFCFPLGCWIGSVWRQYRLGAPRPQVPQLWGREGWRFGLGAGRFDQDLLTLISALESPHRKRRELSQWTGRGTQLHLPRLWSLAGDLQSSSKHRSVKARAALCRDFHSPRSPFHSPIPTNKPTLEQSEIPK